MILMVVGFGVMVPSELVWSCLSTTSPSTFAFPMVAETAAAAEPHWRANCRSSSSWRAMSSTVTMARSAALALISPILRLTIAFDSKRDALGWCGLYPAFSYASVAESPFATPCANISCLAFFSAAILLTYVRLTLSRYRLSMRLRSLFDWQRPSGLKAPESKCPPRERKTGEGANIANTDMHTPFRHKGQFGPVTIFTGTGNATRKPANPPSARKPWRVPLPHTSTPSLLLLTRGRNNRPAEPCPTCRFPSAPH